MAFGAVAGGVLSAAAAAKQNAAINEAQQSVRQAHRLGSQQAADKAGIARQQQAERGRQVRGRLRAAAGVAGVTGTGSLSALATNATLRVGQNRANINRNLTNEQLLRNSQARAQLSQLESQEQSQFLAGVSGALGGAQAALNFGTGLSNLADEDDNIGIKTLLFGTRST